uniref:DEAD/H-box helicase 11 n=1 Tax=Myotis myotis TaxID=51298 RepID=A0A7J7Z254_MYOMY|nr:DEAD/H-box helicase 11 [Myotis myotis]
MADKNQEISGTHFPFPFTPYSIQIDFMTVLYQVLEDGKIGIFESPTGTMDEKINNLCKSQEEIKSDIATIKNTMESFNSRLEEAEDRISELEDKAEKQAQSEQQLEKKIKKQEESLREFWDNMKQSNICKIGLQEGQEEQQGLENLFEEIMTENFPDMGKKKVTQVQRVPSKMNPKRPTLRHVIITMANVQDKERILTHCLRVVCIAC